MPVKRKKSIASAEDRLISQRAAQRLLGDPEILSAFDELETAYLNLWTATKPDEIWKRELAYQHYKATQDVRALLQRRANSAKVRDLNARPEESDGR